MSRFENMNILEASRNQGPRRLDEETLSRIEGVIKKEMLSLDMEDVGESLGYSEEEIKADTEYIKTTQDKIEHENSQTQRKKEIKAELEDRDFKEVSRYHERLGHAFEGFLYSNISESNIFKDVILHKTSEFDDIKNGVDFVAEYRNPDDPTAYIALAMDASFSMRPDVIDRKIERSLTDIGRRQLSQVKYFQFDDGAIESKLGMPRVVVGTDEDRVRKLLSRWDRKENTKDPFVSFEDDPVWTIMALQINEQLELFIEKAKHRNQMQLAEICEKYQRAITKSLRVNSFLVERHKVLLENDGTSIAIVRYKERAQQEILIDKKLQKERE